MSSRADLQHRLASRAARWRRPSTVRSRRCSAGAPVKVGLARTARPWPCTSRSSALTRPPFAARSTTVSGVFTPRKRGGAPARPGRRERSAARRAPRRPHDREEAGTSTRKQPELRADACHRAIIPGPRGEASISVIEEAMLGRGLGAAAVVGFGASALMHLASFTPLSERIRDGWVLALFAGAFALLGVMLVRLRRRRHAGAAVEVLPRLRLARRRRSRAAGLPRAEWPPPPPTRCSTSASRCCPRRAPCALPRGSCCSST